MLYLLIKAGLSGVIVTIVSEVAKRYPGFGALIASLPLVSVLGMIWLWRDKPDAANMGGHAQATFWFVFPCPPLFLFFPGCLREGMAFWFPLGSGCLWPVPLFSSLTWSRPGLGRRR